MPPSTEDPDAPQDAAKIKIEGTPAQTPPRDEEETVTDRAEGSPRDKAAIPLLESWEQKDTLGSEGLPSSIRERFEALRFLGRGGMGTVYRATDTQLRREVALKFIHRDDPRANAFLLREARAQARIEHEHVCKIYEVSVAEGRPYIVMAYVDGAPLSEMSARLTLEEKVKIIRESAAALHEAHRMGLVHRDIKPSNILVERCNDGTYKPYVMDFGLARDAGEQGMTMTGNIAGTPAFMAPEQARGEVRALDRWTDVYSLGATLYDLLAGRPPFIGEGAAQVLTQLLNEDAPSLKSVCPTVPEDLDTITMKCLERDPPRRYESARALAEDLQRYLDGEPVLARRASLRYVLAKRARKHKLLLSVAAALLLGAITLAGSWIRARRLAAAEASLSRELGENVKEMQIFLRYASALPLHDINREREVVRRRLSEIEGKMSAAGRAAEGPGNYAIGSGLLALEAPEKALSHLQRASAAGYSSPELSYAIGLALVELYKTKREAASRIEDPAARDARQKELDTDYRLPALRALETARGISIESPAYLEGLIALYSGKPAEAIEKAKEAYASAPWLYEAKRLEGDAEAALGFQYDVEQRFDYERMMAHFGPAKEAYEVAGRMAESDPEVHLSVCTLWVQIMSAVTTRGELMTESLARADDACAKASAANPHDGRAAVLRSTALSRRAFNEASGTSPGDDPQRSIDEAIRVGEEAVRAAPEDVRAYCMLAQSLEADIYYAIVAGHDRRASITRSMAAIEGALRLDPRSPLGLLQLSRSWYFRMIFDAWRGLDVAPALPSAIEPAERQIASDPSYPFARAAKGMIQGYVADALFERGQSPEEQARRAIETLDEVERLAPDWFGTYVFKSWCYRVIGFYQIAQGDDPSRSLEQATRFAEEARKRNPAYSQNALASVIHYAEGLYLMEQGRDPRAALSKARAVLRPAWEADRRNAEFRVWLARFEILNLRWAMNHHTARAAMFDEALAFLLPLASEELLYPHPYQTLADIYALRAEWLLENKKSAADDIERGLAMAEKALSKNPHLGTAYAARGALRLLSARGARAESARREAAARAKEALSAALLENPLLKRRVERALKEADQLLDAAPARSPEAR